MYSDVQLQGASEIFQLVKRAKKLTLNGLTPFEKGVVETHLKELEQILKPYDEQYHTLVYQRKLDQCTEEGHTGEWHTETFYTMYWESGEWHIEAGKRQVRTCTRCGKTEVAN